MQIRRLLPEDAAAYVALRREALERDPYSFASSPGEDRASDPAFVTNALSDPDQAFFGAFDPALLGITSIYRGQGEKGRHKAHVWGVYVTSEARGRGAGKMLMRAAIAFAQSLAGVHQVNLVVSRKTPTARALYQSLGFKAWGVEPDALCIGGELVDDEHMVLKLVKSR
jgi:ribosomal protein S18 acetylase RimI-like enzyme